MRHCLWACLVLASAACESASDKPAVTAPPVAARPSPVADANPAPAVAVAPDAGLAAKSVPVKRTGKAWPFHAWDRAEAILFNQFAERRAPLVAYSDFGWSPFVADRKPLADPLAREAVELVIATEGGVEVSKCPFPRHAVVLYDHDVPIASINVCFTCGDILVWPLWQPEPDYDHMTPAQERALERRDAKQAKLYDKTFPRWKTFFRDKVGYDIDKRFR